MSGPARHHRAHRGLSLVELLIALALAALMLAPLAALMRNMAAASARVADQVALVHEADLALERIAAVVRASPQGTLQQQADTTSSGNWFSVTFRLLNGQLVQQGPDGVLADNVTGFSITAPAVDTGQQLVRVSLAMARGAAAVSAETTLRLGGPR